MQVEKLRQNHLARLLQQGVVGARPILYNSSYFEALEPHAFAGVVPEGVAAAVGMIEQNPGNWRCWALTDSKLASKYFLPMNRAILRFFAECPARRIETIVYVGNVSGHRWVTRIMGFKPEAIMKKYFDEHDVMLYARTS